MYDPQQFQKGQAALVTAQRMLQVGITSVGQALSLQASVASLLVSQPCAVEEIVRAATPAQAACLGFEQASRSAESLRSKDQARSTATSRMIIHSVITQSFNHWDRAEPLIPQASKTANTSFLYWNRGEPFRGVLSAA